MTIGHLIECVVNRTACDVGYEMNASAYENHDVEKYFEHLEEKGINRYSNEIMYNGRTGQQMNTEIFIGPTYYYRLKHMVNDKINYRDRSGPVENITKQPTQGRANDGGLRIGEMETNAIVAHGISSFAKESLMERSDGITRLNKNDYEANYIYVDENGDEIIYNKEMNYFVGYGDSDIKENNACKVPQAFKLLKQEVQALSVNMKLKTNENEDENEV